MYSKAKIDLGSLPDFGTIRGDLVTYTGAAIGIAQHADGPSSKSYPEVRAS